MSLNAVLSNALSGLAVAQNALAVTSNNVANVNTEGYSRQVAQQETLVIDGRGAGARAVATTRMVDELLGARLREQQARVGRSQILDSVHEQIQDRLFGAPGDADRGLGNRISRVATAAETLAAGPDQTALAPGVRRGSAGSGPRASRPPGAEVQGLRRELDGRVAGTVADDQRRAAPSLPSSTRRWAAPAPGPSCSTGATRCWRAWPASWRSRSPSSGRRVGHGLHPRRAATARRARCASWSTSRRPRSGRPRASARSGSFRADEIDAATGAPAGGRLGPRPGERWRARGPDARAAADAHGRCGAARSSRRCAAAACRACSRPATCCSRPWPISWASWPGWPGSPSTPRTMRPSPYPPPTALAGTRTDTASFAAAARSGTAYLAVIDRGDRRGRGHDRRGRRRRRRCRGPGRPARRPGWARSARPRSRPTAVSSSPPAPATRLAIGEGDSAITATDAAGHSRAHGFAHYFGLNDLLVADGGDPTRLRVRDDLAADPRLLSRCAPRRRCRAAADSARLGGAGDNRGAQALAAAFETAVATVARGRAAGGQLPARRLRRGDRGGACRCRRSRQGRRGQRPGPGGRSERPAAAVSGVNLDEELSRLVLYQEAYSVSARLISITNQLFDELLAIVG